MSEELANKLDAIDNAEDYSSHEAINKLLGYDDPAAGTTAPQGDTNASSQEVAAPVQAPAAPAKAEESNEPPAVAVDVPAEIAGVLTKDGKNFIPYSVLDNTRERLAEKSIALAQKDARIAELEQEVQAVKSGKEPGDELNSDALRQLSEDFPDIAPLVDEVKKLRQQAPQPAQADPSSRIRDEVMAESDTEILVAQAIAQRPLLSTYLKKGGVVWGRAVEIDNELRKTGEYNDLNKRFEAAEKLLSQELGIPLSTPKNTQPATEVQPTKVMPTLTDFGGTSATTSKEPLAGLTPGQRVDAAMDMDMEQLRRLAGINY